MNQALNLELNKPGFWGKHTSSINWCEPDYQHSFLIAETFNTISNSFYLLGSLLFLFQLRSLLYSSKQSLPKRWYSLPLSGALVGVGSWMFHMTLRYPFQVMDELSMLIGMLCVIFCCLTYDDYKHQAMDQLKMSQLPEGVEKNRQEAYHFVLTFFNQFNSIRSMLIMISCVISFAFLLSVYDPMEPLVFQSMFGMLTFIMLIMVYRQSHYYTTRFPAYNNKSKTKGLDEKRCAIALESVNMHAAAKKRTLHFSIVCILLSALVWNMDNLTCPRFEFLKLHSLWHLFTAMACYYLSPLLLLSYYGDRYDEWMYEMLTKQSEQRSPWTNAQVEPMNVKLTWRFLLFPVIAVLPSLRDKQKKKE